MREFDEWIALVESGEVSGNGFLAASLDFRSALRAAFAAGKASASCKTYIWDPAKNAAEQDAIYVPIPKRCKFDGSQRFACSVHKHDSIDIDPDDCELGDSY